MYGYDNEHFIRISFFGDTIEKITKVNLLTGEVIEKMKSINLPPAEEYIANTKANQDMYARIEKDLQERIDFFNSKNKLLEAQRIEQRTKADIEALKEIGYCSGIENYSLYFDDRQPGEEPATILDFFGDD